MNTDLYLLAVNVGKILKSCQLKLVTAESCTGGGVAQAITSVAGSSDYFERGYITYSNDAKKELLGVKEGILEQYGAVSEQTAQAMAEGALQNSHAQVSIAVTGVAGPGGGTVRTPVGMVCFAVARKDAATTTVTRNFVGDRTAIREQAAKFILEKLLYILTTENA